MLKNSLGKGSPFGKACQTVADPNNQCQLPNSKVIVKVVPISETCPAADTLNFWGLFGREDEDRHFGNRNPCSSNVRTFSLTPTYLGCRV